MKENQNKKLQNKQTLACYSDTLPPGCGSLVVVQCERVDALGAWGSLPDWPSCTVYLPIGSMAHERGRGERRAQAKFYKRTRCLCANNGSTVTFVAIVQDVEEVSNNAVANSVNPLDGSFMTTVYHLSVARRGVTNEQEAEIMDISRRVQRCATCIVDQAADDASVSQLWARRVSLYEPYYASLQNDDVYNEERNYIMASKAAEHLLIDVIGQLPANDVEGVERRLKYNYQKKQGYRVENDRRLSFSTALLKLCRTEQERCSKPICFTISSSIGGPKVMVETEYLASVTADISLVQLALVSSQDNVPVPLGCTSVKINFKGSGKYTFETKASPKHGKLARGYLESVVDHAGKAWKRLAVEAKHKHFSTTNNASLGGHVKSSKVETKSEDEEVSMQPSLNIGVIGDVANGKSTLVRAMTGKRTQQHSCEQQQHGITIRLGFANAAILRCKNLETCGSYSFFPEEDDRKGADLPPCKHCKHCTSVIRRVYFLDCPGHAELMATMLSGASAFDAVM